MTILTSGYVDNAIGTNTRLQIAPSTSAFSQYEEQARSVVQARAAVAGYTIPDTSDNAMVKRLVLGQWYIHGLGFRRGMSLPPVVKDALTDLRLVANGKLPIPGLTPNAGDAIAGVEFSATSGTTNRKQKMSRKILDSSW